MKTKVIDIRKLKHDPEKVVAYWVSQGGINRGLGRDKRDFPYVGIHGNETITGWKELDNDLELIDLPEEEFNTGDRVVDDFGKLATVVGTLDGVTYYKDDDGVEIFDTTLFPIKHYKEPELFEGWVNDLDGSVWETEERATQVCSGGRVFKVREVKDED
jgi:hypothetical protein